MKKREPISQVIDLLDPAGNVIHGMSVETARAIVARGDVDGIGKIDGQFALLGRQCKEVRMARTIGRLMRYFIAKLAEGPALVISDRIDGIYNWLKSAGLADQFHSSYTHMVPAHHMVRISLARIIHRGAHRARRDGIDGKAGESARNPGAGETNTLSE